MFEVFVTRKIPEEGLKLLKKYCEVYVNPYDRILTKDEIISNLKGRDGLLCLLTDKIDRDVIFSNPRLKAISNYAAGYDNIDIKAATERKIPVTNTPDVLTETTAELAWALLFAVARRIVEGDRFTRDGKFRGWAPLLMLGQDISGKTLGIIGAGRIGTAFALKSKGFNMEVLYVSRRRNEILEKELNAKKVDLHTLLKNADFISLHVPLTSETRHLIGEKELRMMKRNAILVNTSRGAVIDEKALVKALKERWIFGAGLDVYENEPEINRELTKLDNVVLEPHIGSATLETRTRMAVMAAENLIISLEGKKSKNCVNPEVFSKN
ncbi:MAG TPA: D-glycerate dehydrogenase [Thermoplasmatales archaeon]|nr:D-glycerate dehydrogenase [Thermoplasmatales archaeon]